MTAHEAIIDEVSGAVVSFPMAPRAILATFISAQYDAGAGWSGRWQ